MEFLLWILERFKEPLDLALWSSAITLLASAIIYGMPSLFVGRATAKISVRGRDIHSPYKGQYLHTKVRYGVLAIFMLVLWAIGQQLYDFSYKMWIGTVSEGLASIMTLNSEWWALGLAFLNFVFWIDFISYPLFHRRTSFAFAKRGIKINGNFLLWSEITSITLEPTKLRIRHTEGLHVYDCQIDKSMVMALRDSFSKKVKMDYTSFLA